MIKIIAILLCLQMSNDTIIGQFPLSMECAQGRKCDYINGSVAVFTTGQVALIIDGVPVYFTTEVYLKKEGVFKVSNESVNGFFQLTKHTIYFHVVPRDRSRPYLITYSIDSCH